MDQAEMEALLREALRALYDENSEIIKFDIGERTLCSQLACILQRYFRQHSVHVEYNRHGVDPKDIELPDSNGELTTQRVYPDLIVHQPGHDDENLLVIEAKKISNPESDRYDLMKLDKIRHQLGYRFAVFIRLSVGQNAKIDRVQVRWT